jgi:hypothetical protein
MVVLIVEQDNILALKFESSRQLPLTRTAH